MPMSNPTPTAAAAAAASSAEATSLANTLSDVNLNSNHDTASTLSRRGAHGASSFDLPEGLKRLLKNMYDPDTNPDGIINAGIADNSLCRTELLEYFLAKDRLKLSPADMTYADRFTSSTRLLEAIADLFNERHSDWPEAEKSPLPLNKVQPDHIAIASGATGVLDELFWNICDEGDGVLLSLPYYNAFDNDLTSRAKARVVEVHLPLPDLGKQVYGKVESLEHTAFAKETVQAYRDAYNKAKSEGINVRALVLCNPHNPTGTIYPRSTVVELAKFAAQHKLHFVSDEIYARSCFPTADVPEPALFESILAIDVDKECGLDPAYVHVVTSASKDFAVNGFRLGVLVSQHNPALQRAMSSVGLLSQSASPAASLWTTWLSDTPFLKWYLAENRRRLSLAYQHALEWVKHYNIPYYPSNSGFFFMINLRHLIGITDDLSEKDGRKVEADFVDKMLDNGIFVAPGTQYHHPQAGWYRFTFSMRPSELKLALKRLETALGVKESFEDKRKELDLRKGAAAVPKETGKGWIQKLVSG